MSHYAVLIIGKNPEQQLAPYNENIEVAPYIVSEVSEEEKERMLEYYQERDNITYSSFEECYKKNGRDWNGGIWKKIGSQWVEFSTYNPNSKWDWYSLGGRWSGKFIKLKPNAEGNKNKDQAYKKDIDFSVIKKEDFVPYAVIYEGVWMSSGDVGWWGITIKENYSREEWINKVWELIENTDDNTLFSFYDLHI